jgi:hypothetical protein
LKLGDVIILIDTEFEVVVMFSMLGVRCGLQVPRPWEVVVGREKYELMGCIWRDFIQLAEG